MKFSLKIACLAAVSSSVFLSSCATIIKQGTQSVAIESQPAGLEFTVKNSEGKVIASGKTPQSIKLDTGAGYFRPGSYTIQTKRGHKVIGEQTVTATISGWYFGNLLIGGLIGMVVVDPLTGAMYSLPKTIDVSGKSTAAATTGGRSLNIASIDTLTPEQRAALVRL